MLDGCKAVPTYYQSFDCVKCVLVSIGPCREDGVALLSRERCEDGRVLRERREECADVMYEP